MKNEFIHNNKVKEQVERNKKNDNRRLTGEKFVLFSVRHYVNQLVSLANFACAQENIFINAYRCTIGGNDSLGHIGN